MSFFFSLFHFIWPASIQIIVVVQRRCRRRHCRRNLWVLWVFISFSNEKRVLSRVRMS